MPFKDLSGQDDDESSAAVKARVVQARARQRQRFVGLPNVYSNSQMPPKLIKRFCPLDPASEQLLEKAVVRLGLLARAFRRIQKIARTIADLAGEKDIQSAHVAEAIQYRRLDRKTGLSLSLNEILRDSRRLAEREECALRMKTGRGTAGRGADVLGLQPLQVFFRSHACSPLISSPSMVSVRNQIPFILALPCNFSHHQVHSKGQAIFSKRAK